MSLSPFPNSATVLSRNHPRLSLHSYPAMSLLITGATISPIDQRSYKVLPNALIYVGKDGLIKAIQEIVPTGAPTAPGDVETFLKEIGHCGELEMLHLTRGEFLIPGFIDTHTVRVFH